MNYFYERRIALRMSQAKIAELVGCNQATICRLEKGLPVNQSTEKLAREVIDKLTAVHETRIDYAASIKTPPPVVCDPSEEHVAKSITSGYSSELAEARIKISKLEEDLREAHRTISNLSESLAAGLGRARALRPAAVSASNARYGGKKHTA